ncbi:high mobility group protein 20A [Drosophila tropicalis]|uniref:high mobility group protein 20A n=1 Tax=Drosophila tropicalis TaxID=46794 RepID=UPI0035AB9741
MGFDRLDDRAMAEPVELVKGKEEVAPAATDGTEDDQSKSVDPVSKSPSLDTTAETTESVPNDADVEEIDKKTSASGAGKGKKGAKGRRCDTDLDSKLKKLTQRRINVAGAPKMPLNGYVRFMNDRREQLRKEQPQRTALEHTKIIGEEWHQLTEEKKAPYMEAAAKDKAIYQEQLQMFFKEHPEIVAKELVKAKKANKVETTKPSKGDQKIKKQTKSGANKRPSEPDPDDIPLAQVKRRSPSPPPPPPSSVLVPRSFPAGEIPIYTNEFLEHNRSTENELRLLRKTKTDLEQQNAVLEQHVDNTKAGYAKVMSEVKELKEENQRLDAYLKGLRAKLAVALNIPGLPELEHDGVNVDNVDKYMHHLANLTTQSSNSCILLRVRDALSKLDFIKQ